MSRTIALPRGKATVNDDLAWGQIASLYEARWRAQMDPEHASTLIADVLAIFVEGWSLTDTHGRKLVWPDDIAKANMGDVLALHSAIMAMLREGGGVDLEEGKGAKAPSNPTEPGPVDTSSMAAPRRRTASRRRP